MWAMRCGAEEFNKLDCLTYLNTIRSTALSEKTIRSGFRESGIYPFNPDKVLKQLPKRAMTPPPVGTLNTAHSRIPLEHLTTPTKHWELYYLSNQLRTHRNSTPKTKHMTDRLLNAVPIFADISGLENRLREQEKRYTERREDQKLQSRNTIQNGGTCEINEMREICEDRLKADKLLEKSRRDRAKETKLTIEKRRIMAKNRLNRIDRLESHMAKLQEAFPEEEE